MAERFQPSADQVEFAASVGRSLQNMLPLSRLHESHQESARAWEDLRALGVFEIASSEQEGGSALGAAEEAMIVVELGRRAVAPSVLATVGAVHLPCAVNRLPSPAGRVAAGYRRGDRIVLIEDVAADRVLVREPLAARLFAYPTSCSRVDTQLWSSHLQRVTSLGEALSEASSAQLLRLRLVDAAALAGLARAALDMAVSYAGMREQFGRPIGSLQAVKHHCANMALAARMAADLVSFSAVALDDDRGDAALQVESAFHVAGSAAIDNCGKNIQIHGGMGFSDEADPHRLLKRARVIVEIAGGLEASLARIGACAPNAELSAHDLRGMA